MSYAKVMASLDASSAASGVEVEVKKRAPDGSMFPPTTACASDADGGANCVGREGRTEAAADERLAYGKAMRVEGNAQFGRRPRRRDSDDAKAMAGLGCLASRGDAAWCRPAALGELGGVVPGARRLWECVRCCDEALKIDGGP